MLQSTKLLNKTLLLSDDVCRQGPDGIDIGRAGFQDVPTLHLDCVVDFYLLISSGATPEITPDTSLSISSLISEAGKESDETMEGSLRRLLSPRSDEPRLSPAASSGVCIIRRGSDACDCVDSAEERPESQTSASWPPPAEQALGGRGLWTCEAGDCPGHVLQPRMSNV